MTPIRVQLSRTKGWRMPPDTVKVDRSTRWGNPWSIAAARAAGFEGSDEYIVGLNVAFFRNAALRSLPALGYGVQEIQAALRGKNLACWCALNAPCHADVLIEIANGPVCEAVELAHG